MRLRHIPVVSHMILCGTKYFSKCFGDAMGESGDVYGTLGKSLVGTQYAIRYTFIIYLRFGISIVELKIRFIIILLKLYTACAATVRASRQAHRQGLGRARATRPTLHNVTQRTHISQAHTGTAKVECGEKRKTTRA